MATYDTTLLLEDYTVGITPPLGAYYLNPS
mgnify:CR=1 FL=1|jgi:hypothetical protein